MTPNALKKLDRELTAFISDMTEGMGRPERRAAMGHYITGLLLDGERKSVQPMAARLVDDPAQADAMRQRLSDCVTTSPWSDAESLRRLALKFERELPETEVFVVDDTGFPKKGHLSVGVHKQYSGTLGRTEGCQVATSLHMAGELGSGCIGLRLYLPEAWTDDRERCRAAGVPDDVAFERKWKLALNLLDQALSWGLTEKPVLADAGYGESTEFRDGLAERGLRYIVGIPNTHLIWPPGARPRVAPRTGRVGRPQTQARDAASKPLQIAKLVEGIPRARYRPSAGGLAHAGRCHPSSCFIECGLPNDIPREGPHLMSSGSSASGRQPRRARSSTSPTCPPAPPVKSLFASPSFAGASSETTRR